MRNIFDQYQQPENRLTHALVCTLANDRRLLRPFLRWLGLDSIPKTADLCFAEQQVPGVAVSGDEDESKGLPDACVFDDDGWAVLFEAKVQAPIDRDQLRRHIRTATRHGYTNPNMIVLAVDEPGGCLPVGARVVPWRSVYQWFSRNSSNSFWARTFVKYLEDFEAKMVAQDYTIRGTITMFNGLRFNKENPYTYAEAKRLLRLLGDELQQRQDLRKLKVDPNGSRRPAITGKDAAGVWDFLPLVVASKSAAFTDYPHLTLAISRECARAATTIPNGVKGGFRTKLREVGVDGFRELLHELSVSLQTVLRRSAGARSGFYLTQRHYPSRLSPPIVDGEMRFDLQTVSPGNDSQVRHQPQWATALFDLLTHKRSNMQCGVEATFSYECPIVRSAKVTDLFAKTWIAAKPLLDLVLE